MGLYEDVMEAADFLREKAGGELEFGLILGSGLGDLADLVEDAVAIPFKDIPNFPASTVAGHKGRLVMGTLKGRRLDGSDGKRSSRLHSSKRPSSGGVGALSRVLLDQLGTLKRACKCL